MCTIDEIISLGTHTDLLGITDPDEDKKMRQHMKYVSRIVETAQTDLEVLPRRIENHLSTQRDARASVQIATKSAQIAQSSLNDSSSMKTIAVMTLIFLPATFACVSHPVPLLTESNVVCVSHSSV
jgi:Mg2+ and Co2+ transporter CorA